MRLFGHYVARPAVLLAALDAALFVGLLRLLGLHQSCHNCYSVHLQWYEEALLTIAFLTVTMAVGLYNRDAIQDFRVFLKRFLLVSQAIFIPAVAFVGITKAAAGLPFGWYVGILSLAISAFLAALFIVRFLIGWCFDLSFMKKRVMILGEGHLAQSVIAFVNGPGRSHLRNVLIGESEHAMRGGPAATGNLALKIYEDHPVALPVLARTLRADMIVVAVPDRRGLPIAELLECRMQGVDVIDALTFWEREAGTLDIGRTGAGWLAFASGFHLDQRSRILKRSMDFIVSLSFLIATLPITLFAAAAIKLESRGPVFYRQERVGLDGAIFKVWKFRSMREDAEKDGVPRWAATGDDRVTRVGRLIRLLRIDEIPQIINVLVGDMSFVGPRPERPFFVEQLRKEIPHYDLRHKVKPGITGWAQINYPYGASIDDARRKLEYDLFYMKNVDLILDLAIIVQTVRVVLFPSGAR